MIEYRNNCVGCPPEMGCLGNACPMVNVKYCICDKCGVDIDEYYEFDGKQLCEECLLSMFERVRVDE